MKKLFLIAGMAVLLCGPGVYAAEREQNVIVVSGNGEVMVEPDMALVNVGVMTSGKKADDCYERNTTVMNAVHDGLKKFDVRKEDIKTVQFNLSPMYEYVRGENKFTGYQLRHIFSVKVRDIKKLGEIVDAAVAAGANEVQNIDFTSDNLKTYEDQAREKAVAEARGKAQTLAKAAGVTLGDVTYMVEQSAPGRGVFRTAQDSFKAMAASSVPAPIMPGEIKIEIHVTVYFAIAGQRK